MRRPAEQVIGVLAFVGKRQLPDPPADKIVVVGSQEIEVGIEVEPCREVVHLLVCCEIGPGVRTGKIDRSAASVRKVSRIGAEHAQGTSSRGGRHESGCQEKQRVSQPQKCFHVHCLPMLASSGIFRSCVLVPKSGGARLSGRPRLSPATDNPSRCTDRLQRCRMISVADAGISDCWNEGTGKTIRPHAVRGFG